MRDSNELIKGALIGGVLAGITALLLAPKSGTLLVKDIVDTYDCAKKNGHDFIEAIKEKGAGLTHWGEEEEECDSHCSLLIGGALGAVVAGIAALLLAPDSGKKLRKVLGHEYEDIRGKAEDFISKVEEKGGHVIDEVYDWKDTLIGLINQLSRSGAKRKRSDHSNIDEILSLAQTGIRLYQQLQNRR